MARAARANASLLRAAAGALGGMGLPVDCRPGWKRLPSFEELDGHTLDGEGGAADDGRAAAPSSRPRRARRRRGGGASAARTPGSSRRRSSSAALRVWHANRAQKESEDAAWREADGRARPRSERARARRAPGRAAARMAAARLVVASGIRGPVLSDGLAFSIGTGAADVGGAQSARALHRP